MDYMFQRSCDLPESPRRKLKQHITVSSFIYLYRNKAGHLSFQNVTVFSHVQLINFWLNFVIFWSRQKELSTECLIIFLSMQRVNFLPVQNLREMLWMKCRSIVFPFSQFLTAWMDGLMDGSIIWSLELKKITWNLITKTLWQWSCP
jgi:hypothetical protein